MNCKVAFSFAYYNTNYTAGNLPVWITCFVQLARYTYKVNG